MATAIDRFVLHPRVTGSLLFHPEDRVLWKEGGTEAVRVEDDYFPPLDSGYTHNSSVRAFLLQYDFRGSNQFQEEENLAFLALYFSRYPEVRSHFRSDILVPVGDAGRDGE